MPRINPLPEHEIAICRRIHDFRKNTNLTRAMFATKAMLSESVIIAVENLRSPLRYWVYKAIDGKFPLNPFWLRSGDGHPNNASPVDDSRFSNLLTRTDLFSEVFDTFLREPINKEISQAEYKIMEAVRAVQFIADMVKAGKVKELPLDLLRSILFAQSEMVQAISWLLEYSDKAQASTQNPALTFVYASVKSLSVKAQWPLLKQRLQKATAASGTKTKLADFLGVELASVSQWLTDKKGVAREPGAETTLRMLYWVQQQERK